jgi:hypothetical protein
MALVARRLGLQPTLDSNGAVVVDESQRTKDILSVVLPQFRKALAYWPETYGSPVAQMEGQGQGRNLRPYWDAFPWALSKR